MNLKPTPLSRALYFSSAFFAATAVALIWPRPSKARAVPYPHCERLATLSFKHPELSKLVEDHAPECDLRELRDALRARH
ncbi:MAG: hypothetical protein HY925_10370 [Elusimicrobia bacterium]|nr:hypothetical protein [Elusimicrobiota bacterium]